MLESNMTMPRQSKMCSAHRLPAIIVLATLLFMLAAPADLQAKKKKKQEHGEISGTVMNQAGEFLAGAEIAVSLVAADFLATAVTGKDGEFSIEVSAEGEYWLKISKQDYAAFETPVFLALGERQSIQINMLDAAAGKRNEAVKAYNAGAAAYKDRDLVTAKQHFLAATEADPSLAEPFLVLADVFMTEKAHAQAAVAAEAFLALKPGDQKGQLLAHEAYQKLGNQTRVDELRAVLGKTDVAPQLAIQIYNEGAIADQKGEVETAIEKFRGALDLDPKLIQAHAGLATVYYRAERYDEALASVEILVAENSDHVQGHRLRFLIQEARGDRKASEEAMAAYAAVDPKGAADLLYQRADLDFRANDLDLARAELLKVLELDPEMARAHYTLGKIYASSDIAKAKHHLRKFIEMAPDDSEVASAKEMLSYF